MNDAVKTKRYEFSAEFLRLALKLHTKVREGSDVELLVPVIAAMSAGITVSDDEIQKSIELNIPAKTMVLDVVGQGIDLIEQAIGLINKNQANNELN